MALKIVLIVLSIQGALTKVLVQRMPLKYASFMIFPALADVLRLLRGGLVTTGLVGDCDQSVPRGS